MFDPEKYKQLSLDNQHKEVYAYFGLAIYYAQVIEHQLLNMILLVNIVTSEVSLRQEYEKCFYALFNKTMGKLIKQINRHYKLQSGDRLKLEYLLKRRNYLTHHYFKDNIQLFATQQGRMTLIKYFDDFTEEIKTMDTRLNGYVKNYLDEHLEEGHTAYPLLQEILKGKDLSTLKFYRKKNSLHHN